MSKMLIKYFFLILSAFLFLAPSWDDSSEVIIRGEIVDSKCALGAMSPGDGKSHKICSIRCIKNGMPPLLKVRDRGGQGYRYYLLSDQGKKGANEMVIPFIGQPVDVKGTLIRDANLVMIEIREIIPVK
ncbi:MAG: hypothetical protein K8R21_09475 [Leptospira sp.]|nr:hypothetical protein [Leptospira sp.]